MRSERDRANDKAYRERNRDRIREQKRIWLKKTGKTAVYQRKYKYGITQDEYEAMLETQDGRCAVCLVILDKPIVDHSHLTNTVRGILCWNCNIALGHMRDDPEILRRAAEYLERAS